MDLLINNLILLTNRSDDGIIEAVIFHLKPLLPDSGPESILDILTSSYLPHESTYLLRSTEEEWYGHVSPRKLTLSTEFASSAISAQISGCVYLTVGSDDDILLLSPPAAKGTESQCVVAILFSSEITVSQVLR
ncbi:hypothetical protein RRG08_019099 [Elysia crispata]|uniref:Uncharacterized protein n=1 Tax=Elysia crispata TaxID=231223 RepID=A0AAE1A581_9GAST|nr:hypothetical protein RRG08_019099 [Elysia crispata]